MDIAVEREKI